MILTRKNLALEEKKRLAPYAVLNDTSLGRAYKEKSDDYRLDFQKDRDRIIHCKAFRRLKGKTQVFVKHYSDHFRTRLTHTLEVAQISRDIARTLNVNEDLAEAIALAHDLGHTPFGHMGEQELDAILKEYGLHFEHNEQSQRIVTELEHLYPDFQGLNLTSEVREGLMKHRTSWDNPIYGGKNLPKRSPSIEAQIVNIADEIAYNNHDIDDGLSCELILWENVKSLELIREALEKVENQYGKNLKEPVLRARLISKMISLMIEDLIWETESNLNTIGIQTLDHVYKETNQIVKFSQEMYRKIQKLRDFLSEKFYFHPQVFKKAQEGRKIIQMLFRKYHSNPKLLPEKLSKRIKNKEPKEEILRDYIAGMTDAFAIKACK